MAASAVACVELVRRRSSTSEKQSGGKNFAAVTITHETLEVFTTSNQSGCVRDWLKVLLRRRLAISTNDIYFVCFEVHV